MPTVAFLALQFLLPARLVLPGMGGAGRPSVALGAALLLWWGTSLFFRRGAGRQPARVAVLLFVAVALLAYAYGNQRGLLALERRSGDRYLITLASWAGIALVLAEGLRRRASIDRVLSWLVGLGTVSALVGALQFYGLDLAGRLRVPGLVYNQSLVGLRARGGPEFNRVYGTMQHYIEFGVVLSMLVPLAIHLALVEQRPGWRKLRWFCVAALASAVPFSISRAGALGIALAFAVLSVVWPGALRRRALVVAVLGVAAFRVLVPGVLGTIKSLFLNLENDPSISARTADYAVVSRFVADRPLIGRGSGSFVPEIYRVLDNQFLITALEAGAVGIAGLLALMGTGWALGRSVRVHAVHDVDAHLGQALAAAVVVAFVTSFTFDSLSFPTFAGTLFVLVGLAGALHRLSPRRRLGEAPRPSTLVAPALSTRLAAALHVEEERGDRPRARRLTWLLLGLALLGGLAAPVAVSATAREGFITETDLLVLPPDRAAQRDRDGTVELPVNSYDRIGTVHQIATIQLAGLLTSPSFEDSLGSGARIASLEVKVPPRSSIVRVRVESQSQERALQAAAGARTTLVTYLGEKQAGLPRSQRLEVDVLAEPGLVPATAHGGRTAAGAALAGALLGVITGTLITGRRMTRTH